MLSLIALVLVFPVQYFTSYAFGFRVRLKKGSLEPETLRRSKTEHQTLGLKSHLPS